MRELTEVRQDLDQVDRELVTLFEKRMALCREVGRYKQAHQLPVLDAEREARVLESRSRMARDPAMAGAVRALFETLMALSRAEQAELMEGRDA